MFRQLSIIISLFLSVLSAQGRPIEKADLDKVNKYLENRLNEDGSSSYKINASVTSGELNTVESEGVQKEIVTGINMKIDWSTDSESIFGDGYIDFGLNLFKNSGNLKDKEAVSLQLNSGIHISDAEAAYEDLFPFIKKIEATINSKGFYQAQVNEVKSDKTNEITFSLTPVSPDAVSISSLEVKAVFDKEETRGKNVTVNAKGTFNLSSDLVKNAQLSLNNLFNALKAQNDPTEDDTQGLVEVYRAIINEFND